MWTAAEVDLVARATHRDAPAARPTARPAAARAAGAGRPDRGRGRRRGHRPALSGACGANIGSGKEIGVTVIPSKVSRVLASNRLGVASVVFFVVAAAAPLTTAAGGATTGYAVTGVLGIPVSYIVIAVVFGVFAVGYVAMSRHISNAGAFYTYVTQGLGRIPGVSASFVALVAYNAMQIGLYGLFGSALHDLISRLFHVSVAWWVCALAGWAVIAVIGVLRVDVNSK